MHAVPRLGRCAPCRLRPTISRAFRCLATAEALPSWSPDPSTWKSPDSWVVFSDLHLSPSTAPTCMRVLDLVHAEAVSRNAGILFLGDFWHVRGALPVETLNSAVLRLSQWTQPTIMLVGNHDQVSLGGLDHALTPLAACSPHIHVMEHPTLHAGALWLPYRRARGELLAALRCAGESEAVRAVFAHVDVAGASLNDAFQARDGVPPSAFPRGLEVYTGHYHRPHTVPGTSIHYVGSPYQVSRGEAGQGKRLLVLDGDTWRVREEIPLDIGPRHFSASAFPDAQGPESAADLRSGDRLRLVLNEAQVIDGMAAIEALQQQGVEVEILAPAPSAAPVRIQDSEDLTPPQLFAAYAKSTGMPAGAEARGLSLLQALLTSQGSSAAATVLTFGQVTLSGFLSFADRVSYPLDARGVVVLTGSVDGQGFQSNGAGKSALAMSSLWCLTGGMDARSEGASTGRGLSVTDVIHSACKSATVRVEGTVNGLPFVVERTARRRGGKLSLMVDGVDRTMQEMRMTQAEIDRVLGAPLLGKTVFYGQSEVNALLEAGDRAFKEELGKLVDLSIWEEARAVANKELADRKAALAAVSTELPVRQGFRDRFQEELIQATARAETWEQVVAQRREGWCREAHGLAWTLEELCHAAQAAWAHHAGCAEALQRELLGTRAELCSDPWSGLAPTLDAPEEAAEMDLLRQRRDALRAEAEAARLAQGSCQGVAAGCERRLQEFREVLRHGGLGESDHRDLARRAAQANGKGSTHSAQQFAGRELVSRGPGGQTVEHPAAVTTADTSAPVCDRCHQPISESMAADTLARLQSEAEEALLAAEQARLAARAAAQASASADAELAARQTARDRARSQAQLEAQQARHAIDTRLARLERELQEHEGMGQRLQSAGAEAGSLLDRLRATLGQSINDGAVDVDALSLQTPPGEPHRDPHAFDSQRLLEQLGRSASQAAACIAAEPVPPGSASAANPHEVEAGRLRAQLATEAARVLELEGRGADLAAQLADLKLVHDALRPTGVVNYLLEGVLADLQATTGTFLAALAPSLTLELKPSRPGRADPEAVVEQVEKSVRVRVPGSQVLQPRSIKQLSGGERRRLALSLALGFSALAKRRGLLQSNLLVLDEVMQHLDAEGCARVAALLRTLPQASVLVVAQRGSAAAEAAEQLDLVVKEQGRSRVLLDHRGEA
ncbi:hypothetical protein ACKKBG_A16000 [Auxenochlorella protothecoides x Auxenochlorella symbiontica]